MPFACYFWLTPIMVFVGLQIRTVAYICVRRNRMTPKNIKTLLLQTQGLMYGGNYEVTLGIEIFDNCFSLLDVNNAIKNTFPNSNPEEVEPVLISVEELWKDV